MSNAILLTNSLSPHGNNVVILLAAAGLLEKVEIKQIDLMKGEHKTPEFLAVNPTGQIAALKDGDVSVYESDAIIRYLAIKYKSPFFPVNDLAKLAAVDSVHTHVRQKVCCVSEFPKLFLHLEYVSTKSINQISRFGTMPLVWCFTESSKR